MNRGKLYILADKQLAVDIDYWFHAKSATSWWGEFILREYSHLGDGDGYAIELEDGSRGRCSIQKRVNMATTGVPPRYRYYFRGSGMLK